MQKKILSVFLTFVFLVSLTACGMGSQPIAKSFDKKVQSGLPKDTLIAENANYRLEYDRETMGIVLTELSSEEVWSSTPNKSGGVEVDELGMPVKKHPLVNSVVAVDYIDYETNNENTVNSYSAAIQNGRVRCGSGNNSLIVEFYFDEAGFMIPVEYILHEDYLEVRIDPGNIQESENQIIKISLLPFMCSAENGSENSYLFVPSGSGALADTCERSQQGISYSAEVYGEDASIEKLASISTTESIRLPVYGAKISENKAIAAIIGEGDDSALIEVKAGSTAYGFTGVYASFQIRGYTNHVAKLFSSEKVYKKVYSTRMIKNPLSVRFYPLTGENANYSGMAQVYRNYLCEEYGMEEKRGESNLNITFIGGTMTTKSFLGIPYSKLSAATTISQAEEIVKDISDRTGTKMSVTLKGFGQTGIDIGVLAGGFKIARELGTQKQLKNLNSLCSDISYGLYIDFDLIGFNDSSSGFSTALDACFNAGEQKAVQYRYNVSVRDQIKDTKYYLLKPSLLGKAAQKLVSKTASWNIDGVSLETLSKISYSDYSDKTSSDYYAKSRMGAIAAKAMETVRVSGKKIRVSSANAYAAVQSDLIADAPCKSSGEYIFFADIPFYEMVFKGYIPLSTESANLSADRAKLILQAVESGCGLGYTVINNWNNAFIDAKYPYFFNSVYDDIKSGIEADMKRLDDYYEKTAGAHILSHTILDSGVRETVFDNGVCVYTNFSGNTAVIPGGEISPLDYLILEKPQ